MFHTPHIRLRTSLEPLEARIAPATFLVTTTADSGAGSFRQAILDANANPGPDALFFEFPSGSALFRPVSSLPTITDTLDIQGDRNPNPSAAPRFILSGLDTGLSNGLTIEGPAAAGSVVQGLTISEFKGDGIAIKNSSDITIKGCFIGKWTHDAQGNTGAGIHVVGSNRISAGEAGALDSLTIPGSQRWGSSNIIGGNAGPGISIDGGERHTIFGNLIGLRQSGSALPLVVPNAVGILVSNGSVTIGSSADGSGNVISGNTTHGIHIASGSGTIVQGNHLGTDVAGIRAVANKSRGVLIDPLANNVVIGGTDLGDGNVISGNGYRGMSIIGSSATPAGSVLVQGNLIGTDATGTKPLGNARDGISLSSRPNVIIGGSDEGARNVISSNGQSGSTNNRDNGITLTRSTALIQGNYIGTDITGTRDLGNAKHGIAVQDSSNIRVGGDTAGAGNLISGNGGYGIAFGYFSGEAGNPMTSGGIVQGNHIGTDITGAAQIGNGLGGVYFSNESILFQVGGSTSGSRNVISGNYGPGISAAGGKSNVTGNYIGLNASGTAAIGNVGPGIELRKGGGNLTIAFNVIAGNAHGIILEGKDVGITNNIIGLDATGSIDLGNRGSGILVKGGSATISLNTISGNDGDGITATDSSLMVKDNRIGTNSFGSVAIPNSGHGLSHHGQFQIATIRGNLVSGNLGDGLFVSGPAVLTRNLVGTDLAGHQAVGNSGAGIRLEGPASITIGSGDITDANIVCANGAGGIVGTNLGTLGLSNNQIGVGKTDKFPALGNLGDGISLSGNQLALTAYGNTIGANTGNGLSLHLGNSAGEIDIQGNSIGFVTIGRRTEARGNAGAGIHIEGSGLLDTEELHILSNRIAANQGVAICVNEVRFGIDDIPPGQKQPRGLIAGNIIGGIVDPRNAALSKAGGGIVLNETQFIHVGTFGSGNIIAGLGPAAPSGIGVESAIEIHGGFANTIAGNRIGTNSGQVVVVLPVGPIWIHGGSHHVIGQGPNDQTHLAENNANTLVGAGILITGGDQIIVAHNSIAQASYGIIVAAGEKHQILYNSISDVVRGIEFDGGGDDAVIAHNRVEKAREFGITVLGDRVTLGHNVVRNTSGHGLSVFGNGSVITGNQIARTGGVGMQLSGLDQGLVEGNLIAGFEGAGILVRSGSVYTGVIRNNEISEGDGIGIQIEGGNFELSRNLIYGNTGMAIDLGADGNTPNDPNDIDTGPNGLQNTATLRTAVLRDGSVIVRGTFDGAPLRTLRLEFFAFSTSTTGAEPGAQFLSEVIIETDRNGFAAIHQFLPAALENSEIVVTVTDVNDHVTSEAASTNLITPPDLLAVGTGSGTKGIAKLVDASALHETLLEVVPYGAKFRSGVRVAHADIDRDGFDDLITAPNRNGRMVRVFSGYDGSLLTEWEAAPRGYLGGVSIAAGDVDGDRIAEIVTALGSGRAPIVTVRDSLTGNVESSFLTFGKGNRAGVNLSMGDLDRDGDDDIVASTRSGVALVKAFTGAGESLSPLIRPFAGKATIGASTAVIPATPHSGGKIAVVSGVGARSAVEFFDVFGSRLMQPSAFDGNGLSSISLTKVDIDGDGIAEIIATERTSHRPTAEIVKGLRSGIFLG
jgi:hypothetical protein